MSFGVRILLYMDVHFIYAYISNFLRMVRSSGESSVAVLCKMYVCTEVATNAIHYGVSMYNSATNE